MFGRWEPDREILLEYWWTVRAGERSACLGLPQVGDENIQNREALWDEDKSLWLSWQSAKGSKGKEVQLKVWIWNESSCNKNGKERTGLRMVWQLQSVWLGDRLCWEAREGGTSDFQITGFGTWGSFIKSSSKSLYIIHCEIRDALALWDIVRFRLRDSPD